MTSVSKHREVGWPREPRNLENHKGTSHWDKVPYNKSRNMKKSIEFTFVRRADHVQVSARDDAVLHVAERHVIPS